MSAYDTVWIRADARRSAGMGHFYRCLNLAEALRPDLAVTFLIDDAPSALLDRLAERGIAWRTDTAAFDAITDQIIIIDGYEFDDALYAAAARRDNIVVAIDDLAERDFDCDIVVCHGPHHRADDFHLVPRCRLLLGPGYALTNPCFFGADYSFRSEVRRVLVGFGGSDPVGATASVARAIAADGLDLHLVLGPGFDAGTDLTTILPQATLHRALGQEALAALMRTVDAAIAAPGGMSYELGAVGVPSLLFAIADNQAPIGPAFEAAGLARYGGRWPLSEATIRRAFADFCSDAGARRALHEACRGFFRQSGVARVAAAIHDCIAERRRHGDRRVTLRPARQADCDRVLAWRNDPLARAMSRNSAPLDVAAHRDWFATALDDERRLLLIGERDGMPVGSVRIDRHRTDEAEISIAIAPEERGHGIGTRLIGVALAFAVARWQLRVVTAEIRHDNVASARAFAANGFELHGSDSEFGRYTRIVDEHQSTP